MGSKGPRIIRTGEGGVTVEVLHERGFTLPNGIEVRFTVNRITDTPDDRSDDLAQGDADAVPSEVGVFHATPNSDGAHRNHE